MASGQKLTLGLLATLTLEAVPFHAYVLFPALLPFFLNASYKSCSVRVFSTACDSASITSFVSKWRPFSFIFTQGNRKVGWLGNNSHVVFGQEFPGEKGSVRLCVVVMQQPVLLSPKSEAKSSHIFSQSQ
jgi:hypothetical protein